MRRQPPERAETSEHPAGPGRGAAAVVVATSQPIASNGVLPRGHLRPRWGSCRRYRHRRSISLLVAAHWSRRRPIVAKWTSSNADRSVRPSPRMPAALAPRSEMAERPHRSLAGRSTPAVAHRSRSKATSGGRGRRHDRVCHDVLGDGGTVTLRVNGRLHHSGAGRTHARTHVLVFGQDLEVRIVDAVRRPLDLVRPVLPAASDQPRQEPRTRGTDRRTRRAAACGGPAARCRRR